jgi:hypothetical protein
MISNDFESSFDYLVNSIDKLPELTKGGPSAFLWEVHLEGAIGCLKDVRAESQAGNMEDAWLLLVKAAETIGYLRGLSEANWLSAPEHDVVELLRKNGGLGGSAKGRNAEQKREEAAKALIAAAPNGRWPSKAAFDLQYHGIVKKVPGFSDTEHQRRKLMNRCDIKATLSSSIGQKRR